MRGRMCRAGVYDAVTYERSTRPSRTASKVPGGADGCLGSIVNFTRPLVAFSTSLAQPCRTVAVRWCCGDTQDDIVSVVVCAVAGATSARLVSSTAITNGIGFDMGPPWAARRADRAVVYQQPAAAQSAWRVVRFRATMPDHVIRVGDVEIMALSDGSLE